MSFGIYFIIDSNSRISSIRVKMGWTHIHIMHAYFLADPYIILLNILFVNDYLFSSRWFVDKAIQPWTVQPNIPSLRPRKSHIIVISPEINVSFDHSRRLRGHLANCNMLKWSFISIPLRDLCYIISIPLMDLCYIISIPLMDLCYIISIPLMDLYPIL